MLRKVPTVLSMRQLDEEFESQSKSCGDSPVSKCVGCKLPAYYFATNAQAKLQRVVSVESFPTVPDLDDPSLNDTPSEDEEGFFGSKVELGIVEQNSVLDSVLLALWEDCAEHGLFRYDVTACPTKVVPGVYGFIAQLNEGRATKKRETEFRVDQVCQPFDDTKFNFKKAYMKEVLFSFEPSATGTHAVEDAVVIKENPNLVLINVSPIEYGHVLLVPRVLDCIPQLVDMYTVQLALRFAMEAGNPWFRVGYNSLGAYASINHLHFQAYYLAAPLPIERAPTSPLKLSKRKRGNVQISRLVNYPVNSFVIEGDTVDGMAGLIADACIALQKANIPHNMLISDCGSRVFLWPQCYAEKQAQGKVPEDLLETGVNPAVWEVSGHLVLKNKTDYATITQDFAWRLLSEVSLPESRFLEVAALCFG